MGRFLSVLNGKKTYILVALGFLAYAAGLTDTVPFEVPPDVSEKVGVALFGLALASLRQAVERIGRK